MNVGEAWQHRPVRPHDRHSRPHTVHVGVASPRCGLTRKERGEHVPVRMCKKVLVKGIYGGKRRKLKHPGVHVQQIDQRHPAVAPHRHQYTLCRQALPQLSTLFTLLHESRSCPLGWHMFACMSQTVSPAPVVNLRHIFTVELMFYVPYIYETRTGTPLCAQSTRVLDDVNTTPDSTHQGWKGPQKR